MGIHITRTFGAQAHAELWDSIHVSKDLKDSLICQALLNFILRSKVTRTVIPLH
jgi:sorbitol-specific phosphotransferase system component IIA